MGTKRYKDTIVYAKKHVSAGTDPFGSVGAYSYSAGDVVAVTNSDYASNEGEVLEDLRVHNGAQQIANNGRTNKYWSFTIEGYLKGGGTPVISSESAWGKLLDAAGYTFNSQTGVYAPDETNTSIYTVHIYKDGMLFVVNRCRAGLQIGADQGKQVMIKFPMIGAYVEPTDVADPATVADPDDARAPILFNSANLDIGTLTDDILNFSTFEFDAGINLERLVNANDDEFGSVITTAPRNPTFSVNPLLRSVSDYNFFNKLNAGGSQAFNITFGSVAGNRYTLAGNCEPSSMSMGDRTTRTEASIEYRVVGTFGTADSDHTITHS